MRVLLDECLPRRLKHELPDHEVRTAPEMGWAGVENGELLRQASGEFDVFITVDRSLEFQQNLSDLAFGIVVVSAGRNELTHLLPLVPDILNAISVVRKGEVVRVGA
ncbi:MAG: DUF5615 family PIN-like protein [Thermoanaerobaculia bacterium]